MVLGAPLGDVVQEERDVEQVAVARLDRLDEVGGEAVLGLAVMLDAVKHADAAQEMLVHRVVMVHVELHHRHDAAEIGDEAAEDAGLVHAPEHDLRRVGRGEDRQEELVGRGILAELVVDELQRPGQQADGVGVEGKVVAVRQPEHADEIDRVAGEGALVGDRDAVVVDLEIGALLEAAPRFRPEAGDEAVEHRGRLLVPFLELRAEDAR